MSQRGTGQQPRMPLDIIVYSDYLCPWCYVAAFRLDSVETEYQGAINIKWNSFILRPDALAPRYSVQFINEGRQRAALEEPGLKLNPWPETEPLPAYSLPALRAAKAAQAQGDVAFRRFHLSLFRAYFEENRDISRNDVLVALARRAGLDLAQFSSALEAEAPLHQIAEEHRQAITTHSISGVPTVLFRGGLSLTGAVPIQMYRQAIDRLGLQR